MRERVSMFLLLFHFIIYSVEISRHLSHIGKLLCQFSSSFHWHEPENFFEFIVLGKGSTFGFSIPFPVSDGIFGSGRFESMAASFASCTYSIVKIVNENKNSKI